MRKLEKLVERIKMQSIIELQWFRVHVYTLKNITHILRGKVVPGDARFYLDTIVWLKIEVLIKLIEIGMSCIQL